MFWKGSKRTFYLTDQHLSNLKDHKYSCSGKSIIEPFFQLFWNWIIKYVPMSIAPNTLTLIGLIVNVLSVLIITYYSPDGKNSLPSWSLFLCAFGLFFYQTLDALDGKQARRTNTSSQLGELFDHGCDAISSNFVVLGSILSVRMGTYPWLMFLQYFITVSLFYMAHWQVYVTGTLQFGKVDVTETQTCVILVYIVSSIFGVHIWDYHIPVLDLEGKMFHFLVMLIGAIYIFWRFVQIILAGGSGRHGATIANTSILFPVCPIALVIGLALTVAVKSPNQIYQQYPCLFLISFGMVACKVTHKLVVAHMTKSELSLWDNELIGPGLLILNQYLFNTYFDEYLVLWICCVYSVINMLSYTRAVCTQIADYLNIYIFSVAKITEITSVAKAETSTKNPIIGSRSYNQSFKAPESHNLVIPSNRKQV